MWKGNRQRMWRQIFSASQTSAPVSDCVRRLRQRLSLQVPCVPPSATEPSRRLLHLSGTVCRRQYDHRRHCQFSAVDWRLNFLPSLTAALTNERLTALTTTWPHYYCYVSLQSLDLRHVKVNSFIIIIIKKVYRVLFFPFFLLADW